MKLPRLHLSRWALGAAVVFMVGVGLVLVFMLTLATNNRALYESNYLRLVGLNATVAVLLLAVIVWLVFKLWSRLRRGKFGARLLLKLAGIFALVGFLPGTLIYTVSYQFVSRSIETWFDVRVETALNAGLNLGRTTLDTLAADLGAKTRVGASSLANTSDVALTLALERLRDQLGATDVVVWSANGQPLASAGESRFELAPDRPSPAALRQVRSQRVVTSIEGLEDLAMATPPAGQPDVPAALAPRIRTMAVVASPGFALGAEARVLQVTAPLPPALVTDALAVQLAHREYQERALARDGLRQMYIGTLTLALFLAVFGAVLLAVLLGNQLVRPLLVLADGMREVAQGDLRPKVALPARDELAGLTRTFAHMTRELADARHTVQESIQQVDAARANLQTILDNLTAGVVVLDHQHQVLSVNPGATRILRMPLAAYVGQPLAAVPGLSGFAAWVQAQFDGFLAGGDLHDGGHWQQSYGLGADAATEHSGATVSLTTLIARGALLPNAERLLVFDDISEVISAQRAQAWGEVARRLAHEIKNPLTPIQLSAERLAMKLEGKVSGPEAVVLGKSVKTIVDQVDAMKRLVNEFRDYARLPAAQLQPLDLNALLADILGMYDQADVPVVTDLAYGLPWVAADAQQVRQVVHNLVQNAQDATPPGAGAVLLRTRVSDSGQWVRLYIRDRGPGFSEPILQRAFEPYVTTKSKGTGLGLAVVKKIMDEHGGRIEITNQTDDPVYSGAQVSLSFKVANLQHN